MQELVERASFLALTEALVIKKQHTHKIISHMVNGGINMHSRNMKTEGCMYCNLNPSLYYLRLTSCHIVSTYNLCDSSMQAFKTEHGADVLLLALEAKQNATAFII